MTQTKRRYYFNRQFKKCDKTISNREGVCELCINKGFVMMYVVEVTFSQFSVRTATVLPVVISFIYVSMPCNCL